MREWGPNVEPDLDPRLATAIAAIRPAAATTGIRPAPPISIACTRIAAPADAISSAEPISSTS
jgi:hypothetical protein